MKHLKFTISITTKNRLSELKITLEKIKQFIDRDDVNCIICDDGSNDKTSEFIRKYYPSIILISHKKSIGYIASRNKMLKLTTAEYCISLDDDAHIVSQDALDKIEEFFELHSKCGVIAFRIFWGKMLPGNLGHSLTNKRVKGFVGCGHVWRMDAWRGIPNYPEWFVFYGEEEFASYQLFKNNWEVHYNPDILVQHRVDIKNRRRDKDYTIRLRRLLRSGWYLYVLFYPWRLLPRRFLYSLYIQFKTKVFKGDVKALLGISGALLDFIFNFPKLIYNRKSLTLLEYTQYKKLPDTFVYWNDKAKK